MPKRQRKATPAAAGRSGSSAKKDKFGIKAITPGLATNELLNRLKALGDVLSSLEQGSVEDEPVMNSHAASLLQPQVISSTSKDVRLYGAICFAEVLRLYAPVPPYEGTDARRIFGLFLRVFQNFPGNEEGLFSNYFQFLETINAVQAFSLLVTLEEFPTIAELITAMLDVVRPAHSTAVIENMVEVIVLLVGELESRAGFRDWGPILDPLLFALLPRNAKANEQAYRLAATTVALAKEPMQTALGVFFNDMIGIGRTSTSDLRDEAHNLINAISIIDEDLLANILPLLIQQLQIDDLDVRTEAIRTLLKVFGRPASRLFATHKDHFRSLLGRFVDADSTIRRDMSAVSADLVAAHPAVAEQVLAQLQQRVRDPNDKVRGAAITAVFQIVRKGHFKLFTKELFAGVSDRCRDRKHSVRAAALEGFTRLYVDKAKEFDDEDVWLRQSWDLLSEIPSMVLELYSVTEPATRLVVMQCMARLLGATTKTVITPEQRARRVCRFFGAAGKKGTKMDALCQHLFRHVKGHRVALLALLDAQKSREELPKARITALLSCLPVEREELVEIIEGCPGSLRKSLRRAMDITLPTEAAIEARRSATSSVFSQAHTAAIRALLAHCCPLGLDVATVNAMLSLMEEQGSESDDADMFLGYLATYEPELFEADELVASVQGLLGHKEEQLVLLSLRVLSRSSHQLAPNKKLSNRLSTLSLSGSPAVSKQAVRALSRVFAGKPIIEATIKKLFVALDKPRHHASHLRALGHLALLAPDKFLGYDQQLLDHTTDVLQSQAGAVDEEEEEEENPEDWMGDLTEECLLRKTAIKALFRAWCGMHVLIGQASGDERESYMKPFSRLSDGVLQMLLDVHTRNGCLEGYENRPAGEKSVLRLVVGSCVAKACTMMVMPTQLYMVLALTMKDLCPEVRDKFLDKLGKNLKLSRKLSLQLLPAVCFAADDPDSGLRKKAKRVFRDNVAKRHDALRRDSSLAPFPESSFAALIYLICFDPDMDAIDQSLCAANSLPYDDSELFDDKSVCTVLDSFKGPIEFFVENIVDARVQGYEFLHSLLTELKNSCAAELYIGRSISVLGDSIRLQVVCDIAQWVLVKLGKNADLSTMNFGSHELTRNYFVPRRDVSTAVVVDLRQSFVPHFYKLEKSRTPKKSKPAPKKGKARKKGAARGGKAKPAKEPSAPTRRNASRASKSLISSFREVDEDEDGEDDEGEGEGEGDGRDSDMDASSDGSPDNAKPRSTFRRKPTEWTPEASSTEPSTPTKRKHAQPKPSPRKRARAVPSSPSKSPRRSPRKSRGDPGPGDKHSRDVFADETEDSVEDEALSRATRRTTRARRG